MTPSLLQERESKFGVDPVGVIGVDGEGETADAVDAFLTAVTTAGVSSTDVR